jgi:lambda family phage portal protein
MRLIHRLSKPFRNFGRLTPLRAETERLRKEVHILRRSLAQSHIRNFAGAQSGRTVENWFSSSTTINQLLESHLVTLRNRSRALARDDNYAKKFIGMVKNNVVGPDGFKLELDIKDDNGTIDQKAVDQIKRAWEKWCKRKNCSVTRAQSYWDVSMLITGTAPASGGFLVRKVRGYDNPFKFALQVIDLDCLDEKVNKTFDGKTSIRMGVEKDQWGAVKFYHIKTENPYDVGYGGKQHKTERVPVEEIIHGFIPMEVEQARELPWFHCSMLGLQMLNGYDEAALVAARIGASKSLWFQQRMDPATPAPNYSGNSTDSEGNKIMDVSVGEIGEVPPGMELADWNPPYPHAEHGSFNKAVLRGLAAGLLCSYNSLANDLEGVNYSSLRAGALDERDQWKVVQRWETEVFHDDVFEDWLQMAMVAEQVTLPQYKFDKFNRPRFMGRRWPWVDPLKDIQAKILAIQNALDSNTDAVSESGGSFEELLATIENDMKMIKEKGIVISGLSGVPPEPEAAETTGAKTETATE